MIDDGHKTKHNILIDLSDIAELLRGRLLDAGLITYQIYEEIKPPINRNKYLAEFIDIKLMDYARWGAVEFGSNSDALNECTLRYLRAEFGDAIIDSEWEATALDYMAEFDLSIIELMPAEVYVHTWNVWTSTLVSNTLILSNQGDYRIITYFNRDQATVDILKRRYSKEVLYQHD